MRELMDSVSLARRAGIPDESIISIRASASVRRWEHNLELIDRLGEIRALGFGAAGHVTQVIHRIHAGPAGGPAWRTAASVAVGIARGADIMRVHDVAQMMRVVKMTDALVRRPGRRP
jgi:dihydropteroate synthase